MEPTYQLAGITIAVSKMEAMVAFYHSVFQIEFSSLAAYGDTLYRGIWEGRSLLFCPASIAKNTALQNRQQFEFLVKDLDQMLLLCEQNGGTPMGAIQIGENEKSVGVKDPDGNSMVFKQILNEIIE